LEGIAYDSLGKSREALNAFLDASSHLKDVGFNALEPMQQALIASSYASLGEMDKALDLLNHALPGLRKANVPTSLAYCLKGFGEIYTQIGQKRKALEYLNEALRLYQQEEDWRHEIQVLVLISALRSSLGESTGAIESAKAAVSRSKEKNDPGWEAQAHFAFGAAYASVGNRASAIAEYNLALQAFKTQRDAPLEATVLNNLGLLYIGYGEFDGALDYFKRALKLFESSNELKMAGYALNNIGIIYYRRGEPVNALRHFEEALAIANRNNDKRLKAVALSSMADAFFLSNSRQYVLNLLKENAAVFMEIEEPVHQTHALINLADAYAALGRYDEALDVLRPVLESRRKADGGGHHGYALREMGHIYTLMGDRDKALKHYAEALSLLEAAGDVNGQIDIYAALGSVSVSNQDYRKAEEMFTKGLALARAADLRQHESLILTGLGFLREKLGALAQAERFYAQAIALSESLRSSAHIEEFKTGLGSISASLYSRAVLLKFKLGKWSEAFELTEKARARTFLDQINSVHIDIRKGADPALVEQEQSLRFDMRSLQERLRKERRENPSSEAGGLMAASLKEKEDSHAALLVRLKGSNPDYADLQSYSPVPLSRIQRLLGPQTTLVSYFVTPDKTLAFLVGSDSVQAVEIEVKEAELRGASNWFRGFASLRDAESQSLKQLHAWLIAPIREQIKTDEVIIVPHGLLHYLPFAALTDGQSYFGDDHLIYHLPSASALPSLRRRSRRGGTRVLSIAQSQAPGLPSLRFADEEAESVAKLYRTQPLVTGRATRAEFLKRAGAYNLLHIAAHAELNATNPLFSRILLSSDRDDSGAIEVREIYGMDLTRTNLVVLSACETQLGAQSKGDDIVGLNRAFIYAGASNVVASLWTVDDKATSFLMKAFYSHLKQGRSEAAALQAAQTATRKEYPHPYYWAAFVLTGDPGKSSRR
jgi:CHAT domain-containing protein/tetratricopeptide (TPR) repeat protein